MAKILKLKKVRPLFNQLITTADRYEEDYAVGSLIDARKTEGSLKEYQTVLAIGDSVRSIKVGDIISINPVKYMRKRYDNSIREDMGDNPVVEVNIPTLEIDGKDCFLLYDSDISYVIEDYIEEEIPTIIQPKKPKFKL